MQAIRRLFVAGDDIDRLIRQSTGHYCHHLFVLTTQNPLYAKGNRSRILHSGCHFDSKQLTVTRKRIGEGEGDYGSEGGENK